MKPPTAIVAATKPVATWIYRELERQAPVAGAGERARRREVGLIDALMESDDTAGVIGKEARARLKRLPSAIYWQGSQATIGADPGAANSAEARKLRGNLLAFKGSGGRLAGLPVLALLYPGFALAEAAAASQVGAGPEVSRDEALDRVVQALGPALARALGRLALAGPGVAALRALAGVALRMRFAMRFGDQLGEGDDHLHRAEHVRQAFNSPFWPFVLASTSVGQEGLDFHPYCHAVVHWNLPSNPVDLEQREGRVHRYKGHAVRRNLAAAHGQEALAAAPGETWPALFEAGLRARPPGSNDLRPYWLADGGARIERHVLASPLSREEQRLAGLKHSLTLYRMVFGQARQDDLVEFLATKLPAEDLERQIEALRVDLAPPGSLD